MCISSMNDASDFANFIQNIISLKENQIAVKVNDLLDMVHILEEMSSYT